MRQLFPLLRPTDTRVNIVTGCPIYIYMLRSVARFLIEQETITHKPRQTMHKPPPLDHFVSRDRFSSDATFEQCSVFSFFVVLRRQPTTRDIHEQKNTTLSHRDAKTYETFTMSSCSSIIVIFASPAILPYPRATSQSCNHSTASIFR